VSKGKGVLALLLGAAGSVAFAAVALSAPVASKAPTISGKPVYDSVLTCNKGTWSSDAVSFDYSWTYTGGGPTFATGKTWHVDDKRLGYQIDCEVVAHDAHGATTPAFSNPVLLGSAPATVKITKVELSHATITISARAGPPKALRGKYGYKPYVTLDRELHGLHNLLQLAGPQTIGKSGRFKITGHDSPGKHTYVIQFVPPQSVPYLYAIATRTVKLP
jgi:hypothetical protein